MTLKIGRCGLVIKEIFSLAVHTYLDLDSNFRWPRRYYVLNVTQRGNILDGVRDDEK